MSDESYLWGDPWANEWVDRETYCQNLLAYAENARTARYRLRRVWERLRHGWWLPDATRFLNRYDWVQGLRLP